MLRYSFYLFYTMGVITLIALLYPSESAFANIILSAPIDVIVIWFSIGAIAPIFSQRSLEAKCLYCMVALTPVVVLLARLPIPL